MSAVRAYSLHEQVSRPAANYNSASTAPSSVIPFPRRYAALEPMAGGFAYDSLGNLRSKQLGDRTVSVAYDNNNRAIESVDTGASGTRTMAYDTRGNVAALGGQGFSYDEEI